MCSLFVIMKNFIFICFAFAVLCTLVSAQDSGRMKLKGQVVCSQCWFEAKDRKKTRYGNAADIQCAEDCSGNDIPQALAVEDEKGFTLYILEPGAFKPKGKDFLENVPAVVEVEGIVRTENDKRFLKVNSLKVLEENAKLPALLSDDAVLALKDLTGADQSLAAMRGRVVVLNFWATWCVPCQKEMPDLSAIQNDYAALGVQVVGAAGDAAADGAKVLKFIREFKVNFPVWMNAQTSDMERFGVGRVLPATVIVDKNGKIIWRTIGAIKPDELRRELDKILLPKVNEAAQAAKRAASKTKNTSLVPA